MRKLDKWPDCRVEAVQKHGASYARSVEHGSDFVCDLARDAWVLLLDFNQDAENPVVVVKVHKALRIDHGGETSLDPDSAMSKQFHHGRRVGL